MDEFGVAFMSQANVTEQGFAEVMLGGHGRPAEIGNTPCLIHPVNNPQEMMAHPPGKLHHWAAEAKRKQKWQVAEITQGKDDNECVWPLGANTEPNVTPQWLPLGAQKNIK